MEKIIHKLINDFTEGVDTYTHNGSTWLIFTESKQWVIELTDGKTLWYNYNFFKGIFSYTSMDVVDNQQYITKWVEDNVINGVKGSPAFAFVRNESVEDTLENGVRHTTWGSEMNNLFVDDTLQNGVKETNSTLRRTLLGVDDIIQKGVKSTISTLRPTLFGVDDIIQDGIKETCLEMNITEGEVDDIIQDGVKETIECNWNIPKYVINEVVNDGVKHTEYGDWLDGDERLDDIINNGVKKTSLKRGTRPFMVKDTIKNGVKETNPVDVMKFFDNKMEDALQNGVKETKQKKNAYLVLDTSGRELILESHLVIRDGVKETNYDTDNYTDDVKEVIREGVKETKTPGKDGDILSTIEWMEENKSTSYTKMIDDVIDNGEKINGTYAGGQRQSEKCKSVVEYGTKKPTD